ncbi:MAG TPA: rRNA maturation RNase YbeY [Gammaproteobacteria bacterium]|nr:rRNA maturation RNase YbeY [Gammaproteobacteria bacterium]
MTVIVEVSVSEDLTAELDSEITGSDDVPPDRGQHIPEQSLLQAWATASYLNAKPAVTSMLITTMEEMQQLNKQYREKDRPTNVLSFPMRSPEVIDMQLLGDIALCASIINQEAIQQSMKKDAHWAHMVVHGMLHLQGFDHIENSDAEEMEQLEIKILGQLGIANPYRQTGI